MNFGNPSGIFKFIYIGVIRRGSNQRRHNVTIKFNRFAGFGKRMVRFIITTPMRKSFFRNSTMNSSKDKELSPFLRNTRVAALLATTEAQIVTNTSSLLALSATHSLLNSLIFKPLKFFNVLLACPTKLANGVNQNQTTLALCRCSHREKVSAISPAIKVLPAPVDAN